MSVYSMLIVDDEKKVFSALERELAEEGYVLYFASSGEEALAGLADHPCQVIISDIKMPGMDGLTLLQKVRELYPGMIRIVLSGHADIKLILESVNRYGIDRYLTKPWDPDDLKLTIRQGLELFELKQELAALRQKAGRP